MTIADDVSSARRVHSGRSTREIVVDLVLVATVNFPFVATENRTL